MGFGDSRRRRPAEAGVEAPLAERAREAPEARCGTQPRKQQAPHHRGRPFAERTQAEIDQEVSERVRRAERDPTQISEQRRDLLDALVARPVAVETVDGPEVYQLADRQRPS